MPNRLETQETSHAGAPVDLPDSNALESKSRFSKRLVWILIGVLLLCGLVLRSIDLTRSLWLDELHTSWSINGDLSDVNDRAAAGNQSPLYFWSSWVVVQMMGHSEWSLRFLSVLAGTITPLLVFLLIRSTIQSTGFALVGMFWATVDPYLIQYSQEARPYALVQTLGLLQMIFFVRRLESLFPDLRHNRSIRTEASEKSRVVQQSNGSEFWWRAIWIGSAVAGFYLHFTAALLSISLLLFVVVTTILSKRHFGKQHLALAVDYLVLGLACLPMMGHLLGIAQRRSNWELFVNDDRLDPSLTFQLIFYLAIPVAIAGLIHLVQRGRHWNTFSIFGLILIAYLGPIWLSWLSLKTGLAPLYLSRYFLVGWPFAIVSGLIGWFWIRAIGGKFIRLLVDSCLMGLVILSLFENQVFIHVASVQKLEMPFESPWRQMVTTISDTHRGGQFGSAEQVVVLMPNLIEDKMLSDESLPPAAQLELREYCAFPLKGLYDSGIETVIAKPTLQGPRFRGEDLQTIMKARVIWLIIRGNDAITQDLLRDFEQSLRSVNAVRQPTHYLEFPVRGAPGNGLFLIRIE